MSLTIDQKCKACGGPMEPIHRDPFLCENCLREIEADLARLDSDMDSQADGHK